MMLNRGEKRKKRGTQVIKLGARKKKGERAQIFLEVGLPRLRKETGKGRGGRGGEKGADIRGGSRRGNGGRKILRFTVKKSWKEAQGGAKAKSRENYECGERGWKEAWME